MEPKEDLNKFFTQAPAEGLIDHETETATEKVVEIKKGLTPEQKANEGLKIAESVSARASTDADSTRVRIAALRAGLGVSGESAQANARMTRDVANAERLGGSLKEKFAGVARPTARVEDSVATGVVKGKLELVKNAPAVPEGWEEVPDEIVDELNDLQTQLAENVAAKKAGLGRVSGPGQEEAILKKFKDTETELRKQHIQIIRRAQPYVKKPRKVA